METSWYRRTHYCGQLRKEHIGQRVSLNGWVNRRRDHGGVIFIDLRDRTGLVQIVFNPNVVDEATFAAAEKLRSEYVINVLGEVRARLEGNANPNLATGEIEVFVDELHVLNEASTPPFAIDGKVNVDEAVRLKYRYLDLRREEMQSIFSLRHRVMQIARRYLDEQGFWEVETPMLIASTPEGARDFLVPSRLYPGKFYALPQSPQMFKQLLMISGFDRYFQIARCLRDEDPRADRQPEFTQIDAEMSFVDQEDVMGVIEGLVAALFKEVKGIDVSTPFPRMLYMDAMNRFGSDKPDTRFGLELTDVSEVVAHSGFGVFANTVAQGGNVKGINAKGCGATFARREIDELVELAGKFGAKGLVWMVVTEDGAKGSVVKFFTPEELSALIAAMQGEPGDLLLFVADKWKVCCDVLGRIRLFLGNKLNLIDHSKYNLLWVVEWPLFEYNEKEGRWDSAHHPFTAPLDEDLDLLESDPGKVRAKAYDIVLNGYEVGGGSIRIHDRSVQEKVFRVLGLAEEQIKQRFGFFLEAFEYGTPPHGGIALGLDRWIMLFTGRDNIRDVIAFPKTASALDLMCEAPSKVDPQQLEELGIRLAPELQATSDR